ncbi:carbon-nitrogen hydrolase family protein [Candidatus Bathycorpusculum sp.]|uniref:carbon-nitrogen hydrolase family protein n=1 Tax=Candidatus Bathycorpusculum sp. TaxID=2994959 RepID=UPI002817423A|nr:carbon-nitrogen hydrolase family protein [Candidatus Termitimicrobium sp.]MCL2432187.1 carbon-nitrogen hydrolase family protein [Candidatus Termitimicrobium sp.]
MKVSILHMEIRNDLQDNLTAAKTAVLRAAKSNPVLIALPEYFTVPCCMAQFSDAPKISRETCSPTLDFLQRVSIEIGDIYLLGGSVLQEDGGKYYNTSTLWQNGIMLAKYKKINPIQIEVEAGVSQGNTPMVLDTQLGRLGMIVCADSFDPNLVRRVAELGAEIVTLPVAAMGNHPVVKGHPLTEAIARDYGMFILKIGNVSSNMRGGRSAIVAPWGILGEVTDAPEDSILTADLDMEQLKVYRQKLNKSNAPDC